MGQDNTIYTFCQVKDKTNQSCRSQKYLSRKNTVIDTKCMTAHLLNFYITKLNYQSNLCFTYTVTDHFCMTAHQVRKEMFYLTTHSTHFIYGYMASDIW